MAKSTKPKAPKSFIKWLKELYSKEMSLKVDNTINEFTISYDGTNKEVFNISYPKNSFYILEGTIKLDCPEFVEWFTNGKACSIIFKIEDIDLWRKLKVKDTISVIYEGDSIILKYMNDLEESELTITRTYDTVPEIYWNNIKNNLDKFINVDAELFKNETLKIYETANELTVEKHKDIALDMPRDLIRVLFKTDDVKYNIYVGNYDENINKTRTVCIEGISNSLELRQYVKVI